MYLGIRVCNPELDALNVTRNHVVDGIRATSTNAEDLRLFPMRPKQCSV